MNLLELRFRMRFQRCIGFDHYLHGGIPHQCGLAHENLWWNFAGKLAAVFWSFRVICNAEDLGKQPLCLCLPCYIPHPLLDWARGHHLRTLQDDVGHCSHTTFHEGLHGRTFVGKPGLWPLSLCRFDVGCHDCGADFLLPRPHCHIRHSTYRDERQIFSGFRMRRMSIFS